MPLWTGALASYFSCLGSVRVGTPVALVFEPGAVTFGGGADVAGGMVARGSTFGSGFVCGLVGGGAGVVDGDGVTAAGFAATDAPARVACFR